jgi:hypothetical protein
VTLRARLGVYALLACLLSPLQFGMFDCSGVKALSFASGALMVFAGLLAIDRVYIVGIAPSAGERRIAVAALWGVAGVAAVIILGWFTIVTHMCG